MILFELAEEDLKWIEERPQVIKDMIARHPPNRLYLLQDKWRVFLESYNENGTLTVAICDAYNSGLMFEREVFGVRPEDLIECDELVGPRIPSRLTDPEAIRTWCALTRYLPEWL